MNFVFKIFTFRPGYMLKYVFRCVLEYIWGGTQHARIYYVCKLSQKVVVISVQFGKKYKSHLTDL